MGKPAAPAGLDRGGWMAIWMVIRESVGEGNQGIGHSN
jgi:hypothetical protein